MNRFGIYQPVRLKQLLDTMRSQAQPTYPFVAAAWSVRLPIATSPLIVEWFKRSCPFDWIFIPYKLDHPLAHFGLTVSTVLQPRRAAEAEGIASITHVSVSEMPDHQRVAQVFSALMHTQRAQSLSIFLHLRRLANAEDRRLHMRWFMYALFSRWAMHSIKHVHVDSIQITDEEVDDLRELLRSENPLRLLYSDCESNASVPTPAKQVLAREKAPLQLDLSPKRQQEGEQDFILLAEDTWLDVIREDTEDGGGWFVLVPAYGKCRLRRVDTLQERAFSSGATDSNTRGSRGVKSLSISGATLRNERGCGVAAILRCFGHSLESLRLHNVNAQECDTLIEVLASCASLQRLALAHADTSVLPHIIKAYETGACKATHLDLQFMRHTNGSPHVVCFYEALADQNQRICQTVRELLFFDGNVDPHIPDEEAFAMRTMLAKNSTLQYFERRCELTHNEAFVELLEEYNAARHTAINPLPRRIKCAFLSVVSSNMSSTRAISKLDSVMITRIFEMAAEPVVRRAVVGSALSHLRQPHVADVAISRRI